MEFHFRRTAAPKVARALASYLIPLCLVLGAACASGAGLWAACEASDANSAQDRVTELDRIFEGQACLVCGKSIEGPGVEVRMRGRRVYLHSGACREQWLENPNSYFAQLQPKGALWDESGKTHDVLFGGWFWFGLYVLGGLIFGALSAYGAINRGLNPRRWFFAGLLVNVFALITLLARGHARAGNVPKGLAKVALTHQPVPCPACPAENHPSASHCSRCGTVLDPTHSAETERC